MTDINLRLPAWEELRFITDQYSGRVLDAGCSNGDYTLRLMNLPQVKEVISVDIQPIEVPHHGQLFQKVVTNGVFYQADVQDLPFPDNHFDCVLCWDMLQNVPDGKKALSEFHRVTRPGGLVSVRTIIKDRCPWVIPGVTPETGSSGHTFINWTIWNPRDLEFNAKEVGLEPIGDIHIDPWDHQTLLARVIKVPDCE